MQALSQWMADRAVLPVENSLGGSIHLVYDLLLRYRLHIVGEVSVEVNHCLMALPGTKKEDVKRVMSHPQVGSIHLASQCLHECACRLLAQVRDWLATAAGLALQIIEEHTTVRCGCSTVSVQVAQLHMTSAPYLSYALRCQCKSSVEWGL